MIFIVMTSGLVKGCTKDKESSSLVSTSKSFWDFLTGNFHEDMNAEVVVMIIQE